MEPLRLYNPVTPYIVGQGFGQNLPCVRDFGMPTQDIVTGADNATCPVGYDKLYQHFSMDGHNGTDLQAGEQPVRAACAGTVVEIQDVPARGLGVGILTDQKYDVGLLEPYFMKIRYWHLKNYQVQAGDKVVVGQVIGISNNTGYSSGNHLHFEGQPMLKDEGGHPYLPFGNAVINGKKIIAGAIDTAPFMTGIDAANYAPMVSLYQTLVAALTALVAELKKPH